MQRVGSRGSTRPAPAGPRAPPPAAAAPAAPGGAPGSRGSKRRAPTVVGTDELRQHPANVPDAQEDEVVQGFLPQSSDEPLNVRSGVRGPIGNREPTDAEHFSEPAVEVTPAGPLLAVLLNDVLRPVLAVDPVVAASYGVPCFALACGSLRVCPLGGQAAGYHAVEGLDWQRFASFRGARSSEWSPTTCCNICANRTCLSSTSSPRRRHVLGATFSSSSIAAFCDWAAVSANFSAPWHAANPRVTGNCAPHLPIESSQSPAPCPERDALTCPVSKSPASVAFAWIGHPTGEMRSACLQRLLRHRPGAPFNQRRRLPIKSAAPAGNTNL